MVLNDIENYSLRSLETDCADESITLPKSNKVLFNKYDLSDIKDTSQLCVPKARNFAAIDAIIPSKSLMFQFSVNNTHEAKKIADAVLKL